MDKFSNTFPRSDFSILHDRSNLPRLVTLVNAFMSIEDILFCLRNKLLNFGELERLLASSAPIRFCLRFKVSRLGNRGNEMEDNRFQLISRYWRLSTVKHG